MATAIAPVDRTQFLGGSDIAAILGVSKPREASSDLRRLVAKIVLDKESGCFLWTASLDKHGYGQFRFRGTTFRAHRAAYILLKGEILGGLDLDHLCRNPRCVNPEHLEPVAHIVNVRRGNAGQFWAQKTHCPRGHEYTPENIIRHCQSGARICRTCDLKRRRLYNRTYKRKSRARLCGKRVPNGSL